MITAEQLVAHAIGDYVLQSDWMANEKTKQSLAAAVHALSYALPFLFLRPSVAAFAVIVGTHFLIDRWRLARFVVWVKNFAAPCEAWRVDSRDAAARYIDEVKFGRAAVTLGPWALVSINRRFDICRATGYDPDRPAWLAVWLLIIADNVMHVLCNAAALAWL